MKVHIDLIYPAVNRTQPHPSFSEKRIPIVLNIGCNSWQENTAMRQGFCNTIFAGAGNHPGNDDGQFGAPFDAGDPGINNVHGQWVKYRTRSMSVGDVVCIDPDGAREFWICDSVGWDLLTEEQANSWLKFPRSYGCCSFEVNDWMTAELNRPLCLT